MVPESPIPADAAPLEVVEDKYMPCCPRCLQYTMTERSEEVPGAPYAYTHQCDSCGMGVHHTSWDAAGLSTIDDLLTYMDVGTWEDFVDWVCNYTDDLARVEVELGSGQEPDQLTTYGNELGQIIELPSTVREVMFDLQSAEDNVRQDWRACSDEAARRLVPLSDVYGDTLPPERDAMPEDWSHDEDGGWHPPDCGGSEDRPRDREATRSPAPPRKIVLSKSTPGPSPRTGHKAPSIDGSPRIDDPLRGDPDDLTPAGEA